MRLWWLSISTRFMLSLVQIACEFGWIANWTTMAECRQRKAFRFCSAKRQSVEIIWTRGLHRTKYLIFTLRFVIFHSNAETALKSIFSIFSLNLVLTVNEAKRVCGKAWHWARRDVCYEFPWSLRWRYSYVELLYERCSDDSSLILPFSLFFLFVCFLQEFFYISTINPLLFNLDHFDFWFTFRQTTIEYLNWKNKKENFFFDKILVLSFETKKLMKKKTFFSSKNHKFIYHQIINYCYFLFPIPNFPTTFTDISQSSTKFRFSIKTQSID